MNLMPTRVLTVLLASSYVASMFVAAPPAFRASFESHEVIDR